MQNETLSVIQIGHGEKSHGLYSSLTKSIVLSGLKDELFEWKDKIETAQQQADNKEYMRTIREERIALLVGAGNTTEEAELFLQKQFPYLYETN